MKTLEQEFAIEVYSKVKDYTDKYGEGSQELKDYSSMADRLPILVRTAGLVQTLAFVATRGKDPHKELLLHLAQVVKGTDDFEELMADSRNGNFEDYRYLTQRVNLALGWFKRFSQSVPKVEPGGEED